LDIDEAKLIEERVRSITLQLWTSSRIVFNPMPRQQVILENITYIKTFICKAKISKI